MHTHSETYAHSRAGGSEMNGTTSKRRTFGFFTLCGFSECTDSPMCFLPFRRSFSFIHIFIYVFFRSVFFFFISISIVVMWRLCSCNHSAIVSVERAHNFSLCIEFVSTFDSFAVHCTPITVIRTSSVCMKCVASFDRTRHFEIFTHSHFVPV